MLDKNAKKILMFIEDSVPTEAELAVAAQFNTKMFRNVQFYHEGDCLEDCDGVAGCAPERYVTKFGRADEPKKPQKPAKSPPPTNPPPSTGTSPLATPSAAGNAPPWAPQQ